MASVALRAEAVAAVALRAEAVAAVALRAETVAAVAVPTLQRHTQALRAEAVAAVAPEFSRSVLSAWKPLRLAVGG